MKPFAWLWPTIIIFSTIAVGFVNFVSIEIVLRPIIAMWFLFVCPGMTLVRFLRLSEPAVEWTLALTLKAYSETRFWPWIEAASDRFANKL